MKTLVCFSLTFALCLSAPATPEPRERVWLVQSEGESAPPRPRFAKDCAPSDDPVFPAVSRRLERYVFFSADPDQVRVIDGDGLCLGPVEVRLKGVDAPEWFEEGADLSSHALAGLVAGHRVTCSHIQGDVSYDRLVARCVADGVDLGARQVALGYAEVWRAGE